jgi:pyruvate formate lyase activating enzyme
VSVCPTNALNLIGRWRDVDDLVSELFNDRDYWSGSGGGVTISGGEAALQTDALHELLAILRRQGIHTVLQTNGNMAWEKLELIAQDVNLVHFDLKGIDNAKHRANTGVGNERILANARCLSEGGYPVVFRVPLVPGHNNSPDDLLRLKDFLDAIGAGSVDVLPYHNLGERKLELTGMEGNRLSLPSMNYADAADRARILEGKGRVVMVGGERIPAESINLPAET